MNRPNFRNLKKGDKISAREYNRRGDMLAGVINSLHVQGYQDSTGLHTRRFPSDIGKVYWKVFAVQSEGTGDGIYNCFEQILDATDWPAEDGTPKFDDKDAVSVEVLNLAEHDSEATYVAHLAAGDIIMAFEWVDDENNTRWIGVPFRQANADRVRIAYCKTDAPAATTITCFLDTDTTGTEIEVACSIAGGGNLNKAIPRLTDGLLIRVSKVGATWRCETTFQAIDETKGLEIVGGKLAVNIDTTELQFSVGGAIKTKLDECPLG